MRSLTHKSRTALLLGSGVVGPLLFIVVFFIEGFTRPDYDSYRTMVSELSLSSWGWQQIANFLMCGTLMLAFAIGLRRVQTSRWAARVLTLTALGMLLAGMFAADPGLAYPAGAPDALPLGTGSWHGQLHAVAGFTVFFSLPIAIGLMAAWFGRQRDYSWLAYTLATLVIGFTSFMASNITAMHGGPAGLFQRVAIIAYFTWLSMLALHLNRVAQQPGHRTESPLRWE